MYTWPSHIARVRVKGVRWPLLLVISWTGEIEISLSPFALKNWVSRDGFGSPVPRHLAHLHTKAESGAYRCLRDSYRFPWRRPYID